VIVCRFTRDLRLEDHAALATAADRGPVLPALVVDGELNASLRRSPRRAAFFAGAVRALDEALRERGSRLVVRRGEAPEALVRLARESGASGIVWSARYDGAGARADLSLRASLEEAGVHAQCVHDAPAIGPEEIARSPDGGYRAFQPYFERWRSLPIASYDRPILLHFAQPESESEALPAAREFGATSAAEDAAPAHALERLQAFLDGAARGYAADRYLPAVDGTSRLCAHLSFGTLALRTAVRATQRCLENPFLLNEERRSLRLFLRSLALRDFFLQLAWFHPETDDAALQVRMREFAFARQHPHLDAWREGRTGYPLVDAGIRQLRKTGWMHPHVRSVAASFLCFDLGVDWRVGRETWDRFEVEDDAAIASGNWQWIAGIGADLVQYPRIYNPRRQQLRFDPLGEYVRRWIPELAHAPLHGARERVPMLPLYDAASYPSPVVDHAREARAFLERYRSYAAPRRGGAQGSPATGG